MRLSWRNCHADYAMMLNKFEVGKHHFSSPKIESHQKSVVRVVRRVIIYAFLTLLPSNSDLAKVQSQKNGNYISFRALVISHFHKTKIN